MSIQPPKWADRFLKWYCKPELLEEIQGDVHELFDRRKEEKGPGYAKRKFVWDVMRFFRWSNIGKSNHYQRSNSIAMFKNYIKVGFRNMTRHWVTSSVNIVGLSLALGCLITLFIFIDMQLNMDNYHSNAANIYQVINHVKSEGKTEKWGDSPIELGPALVSNHSQVEEMFRIEHQYANVKYDDKVFNELLAFTDPGFLRSLDFSFLNGNASALESRDKIVISYHMAEKYFDFEEPVGELLAIKFNNGKLKTFEIGAVLDKYPYNTSLRYDFILPFQAFLDMGLVENPDWSYFTDATFVVLNPNADRQKFTKQLSTYVTTQNSYDPEWQIDHFELISLEVLAQHGHNISGAVAMGSHPAGQFALGVVAILLTILACFNYMNISIAASTKRLKEIALRKVVGSNRGNIIGQFLTENVIQVILALLLGTLLSYFLLMPGFNSFLPFTVPFRFTSIPEMVLFFLGILLIVGLISSLYPSLYVSKFQPVNIFKGNTRFGSRNLFSKVLLVFQLIFAFTTVVGCFLFTDHAIHFKNQTLGYDGEDIIAVKTSEPSQFAALKAYADENPQVKAFTGTKSHICTAYDIMLAQHLETEIRSVVMSVSPEYPQLMNISLKNGNYLNEKLNAENHKEILVNEELVRKMNWDNPLGQTLTISDQKYKVVGVLEDFKYQKWFAYIQLLPTIIRTAPEEDYQYAVFQSTSEQMDQLDEALETTWLEIAPNDPYERVIQANAHDELYNELNANITIISAISVIAIILACLGLFGLLSFNIQRRLKEFSIRKILGASPLTIIRVASRQYLWIVLIGFGLGAPFGFLLINSLVQTIYQNPKPTGPMPFILAVLIMVFTLSLTIVGQLYKATSVNPVNNLRNE